MIHLCGPTFQEASKDYPGADFVGAHTNFSADDFARMIAKIGFCAAVSALGLGPFTNTPIRKVILGSDPCIGYWVGSWWGEPVNGTHGGLHEIRVMCSEPGSQIHAFVKLFAQFGAPEYQVLLGPADPAFVASSAWPSVWDQNRLLNMPREASELSNVSSLKRTDVRMGGTEIYDFGEISAHVTAAMREYTQPFVASISRAISHTEGEQQGSGGYIELREKPHLITNEHVSSAVKMRPLVHHLAHEAYGVRITNPFYEERFPIDLAVTRIDDIVWKGPNEKKALPAQRIAMTHNPVEHELLFITGFSGERSRFSPLLETLFSTGTPYLTQERQLPSSWQSPRWFSLLYTPPNTTSLDPAARGLPDPHGFSGSLVWDTKAVLCLKTGTEWHPDLAEVTGIIWGWDSKDPCLLAIRAEFVREFLLNALRNEAAYFHWLSRGQPENDDWPDWFWATREIPYLS